MNRDVAYARAETLLPMTFEPAPLSEEEIELLVQLIDSGSPASRDLLAFTGASTAAGLLTRLVVMSPDQRRIVLMAIRKAIGAADQV